MTLTLRTPRRGADLLTHEADANGPRRVRLSLADDLSLGYPRCVVLVPVDVDETNPDPRAQVKLAADGAAAGTWPVLRPKQTDGIYTLTVNEADWPAGGDHVLVLLVFNQGQAVSDGALTAAAQRELESDRSRGLKDWRNGLVPQFLGAAAQAKRDARPTGRPWSFVLASCQYPHDILDRSPEPETPPIDREGPADRSLVALAELFARPDAPDMLLQCGDQVYVDATAGLFDPTTLYDKYRRPYTLLRQSRGGIALQRHRPLHTYRLIDDHEIADNWAQGDDDDQLKRGVAAYWQFQRGISHGLALPDEFDIHRIVTPGPYAFFLADTRTHRQRRTAANYGFRSILGNAQERELHDWLKKSASRHKPCFVASPSAVLPRPLALRDDPHAALHCDTWAGYPHSLIALLALLARERLEGVVFLSGDEHVSSLTLIELFAGQQRVATAWSVHSSGLYAPYPFANARAEDFAQDDEFDLTDPEDGEVVYRCRVQTFFHPGDGFAVVTVKPGETPPVAVSWQRPSEAQNNGLVTSSTKATTTPAAEIPAPPAARHITPQRRATRRGRSAKGSRP